MAFEIVVIGASSGGLKALQVILGGLGSEFRVPLVIVQHRGKDSDPGLCEFLAQHSGLTINEPDDKEPIHAGHVYLAPCDYHLLISDGSFALSIDAPVAFARPSIDLLFESAAEEYEQGVIGVVLTGSNSDGARGLAAIKAHGGLTIVEDPGTAAFREMPKAACDHSNVDWVVPLENIPPLLEQLTSSMVGNYAT
ncbi:MAG TPA: chemotaxis protein CheB [Pyrinomonadaceae bacterium]